MEPPNKRQMMSPYFLPELSHIVSFCEDNVPFVHLASCVCATNLSLDECGEQVLTLSRLLTLLL